MIYSIGNLNYDNVSQNFKEQNHLKSRYADYWDPILNILIKFEVRLEGICFLVNAAGLRTTLKTQLIYGLSRVSASLEKGTSFQGSYHKYLLSPSLIMVSISCVRTSVITFYPGLGLKTFCC